MFTRFKRADIIRENTYWFRFLDVGALASMRLSNAQGAERTRGAPIIPPTQLVDRSHVAYMQERSCLEPHQLRDCVKTSEQSGLCRTSAQYQVGKVGLPPLLWVSGIEAPRMLPVLSESEQRKPTFPTCSSL
jgi:hypothetical protein